MLPRDGHRISIRPAVEEDSLFVYTLSQDEAVRATSIRTEAFSFEQHQAWWKKRMSEPEKYRIYIVDEDGQKNLGVVRYERVVGETGSLPEAEVSCALQPDMRGRGLSTFVFVDSARRVMSDLGVTKITALIRQENTASLRAVEKAGYERVGPAERMGVPLWRYERA